MKTLTLDLKKWRCGDEGKNKLGKGDTSLLNSSGYMCCLGQFSHQLGVKKKYLLNEPSPDYIYEDTPKEFVINGKCKKWVEAAIVINDNERLTTEKRITKLQKLFSKHGFEIKVINA